MRKIKFLLVLVLGAVFAAAQVATISGTLAQSTISGGTITTPAINTTGATVIVLAAPTYGSSAVGTPTDSAGNTWTALTAYASGNYKLRLFYVCGPTTSSTHTFTLPAATSIYNTIAVEAFSGTVTTSCFDTGTDKGANATGSGPMTAAMASISPSAANELIVSAASNNTSSVSNVNSSLTVLWHNESTAGETGAYAWRAYASTSPLSVTWTWSGTVGGVAAIAAFKVPAAASTKIVAHRVVSQ